MNPDGFRPRLAPEAPAYSDIRAIDETTLSYNDKLIVDCAKSLEMRTEFQVRGHMCLNLTTAPEYPVFLDSDRERVFPDIAIVAPPTTEDPEFRYLLMAVLIEKTREQIEGHKCLAERWARYADAVGLVYVLVPGRINACAGKEILLPTSGRVLIGAWEDLDGKGRFDFPAV